MKKHITIAVAGALAEHGWNVIDIDKVGSDVAVAYGHPHHNGRITIWSSRQGNDIVTYVSVNGVPDGYYDLSMCKYVEC